MSAGDIIDLVAMLAILIAVPVLLGRVLTRIVIPEIRESYGDIPELPEEMRRNHVLHDNPYNRTEP